MVKAVHVYPVGGGPRDGGLTYFSAKDIVPGDTVSIKIRGRKTLGIVADVTDVEEDRATLRSSGFTLKKLDAVLGKTVYSGRLFRTAQILSRYYLLHPGITLSTLAPAVLSEPSLLTYTDADIPSDTRQDIFLLQDAEPERVVYIKKLIREYFAKKKSVILILPTLREARYFHTLFSRGIESHTFFFSGDESKKKQHETVESIVKHDHPILLVGTYLSAALPVPHIGTIIIEHESSGAYQSRERPHIDKRVALEALALASGVPIVYSDTFLQIKTALRTKEVGVEVMGKIVQRLPQTPVILDERDTLRAKGSFRALRPDTLEKIKSVLSKNGKVLIFSFRKNFAGTIVCHDCGDGVLCETCNHPLSLFGSEHKKEFYCAHCGDTKPQSLTCKRCNSWNLVPLGIGTDRVMEELITAGYKNETTQIDGRKKDSESDTAWKAFATGEKKILVATEAILSRLPEPIDLAVIASLDSLFAFPHYSAPERAAHFVVRLLESAKETLLQTRYPDEVLIKSLEKGTLLDFYKKEEVSRETLSRPPYKRIIRLSFSGTGEAIENASKKLLSIFEEFNPESYEGAPSGAKKTMHIDLVVSPEEWPLSLYSTEAQKAIQEKMKQLPASISLSIE